MPRWSRPPTMACSILTLCAVLCLCLAGESRSRTREAGDLAPGPGAGPGTTEELVEQLGNTWFARDFDGYMALWHFDEPHQREAEAAAVREEFAADETQTKVLGPPRYVRGTSRLALDVQVFSTTEPQARVQYWRLLLERRGRRWSIVGKEVGTDMEGLVHLTLAPEAWRVRDVVLRLEDLELRLENGSLYSTPESVGQTALVFVGRGRVRFSPRPASEGEQLRQFSGASRLDQAIKWAFVRLHPGDVDRLIDFSRLERDPDSAGRLKDAVRRWSERSARSFIVDANLPGSPWWLSPNRGDALVEFPWKRGRVLTYSRAGAEHEDVNLFERDRGLEICSYPSGDRPQRLRGAAAGVVDVLHHTLIARFEPDRFALDAVDTLRLRLLSPAATLRLKLHDDFRVSSVSTGGGERLLFLRVREQGSLVVSLGPHAGRLDEFTLTVRYSGRHRPLPMSQDLLQAFPEPQPGYLDRALLIPPPLIYSNRTAWYPQPDVPDYATLRAHFDTPEGVVAVTGGELMATSTAEGRTRATYQLQQPGKYFTAILGPLEDVGTRRIAEQVVHGFAGARSESQTRENLVTAQELLAFFAERYGPSPYPVINHVVVEAVAPAGHSPPGLVYLQRRPVMLIGQPLAQDPAAFGSHPDFFLAHELAHQWWGQGVAPATYREQWLSEAWAQYSAALWVQHRKGESAFRGVLDQMAQWARRYDKSGPIHLGLRLGHLKGDGRLQRSLVYNKGAWVLHMLRQRLGDEAFFAGARSFLEAHRYGKATTEDLRAALEEAGACSLEPFFERWIYDTGLPQLRWATRSEETPHGYRTTVQVAPRDLPGPFPLEIQVTTKGNPEVRRVELDPGGGSWTIPSLGPVRDVRINEDRGLLAEVKKMRRLRDLPQR